MDIHLDMETQDPDDVFTLCLLATHPRATLKGVTLFPGGRDQVGVVKHILERLGRANVPVGASVPDDGKQRVSQFHYKWLGKIEPRDPDALAAEVLKANINCTLITGAPLRNVHQAYKDTDPGPFFTDWTCQGGFAGANIVAPEHQLEKFKGKVTCPTFNLNGDVKAALALLGSPRITTVRMVSKNVCHGMIFTPEQAEKLPRDSHAGLDLLLEGMWFYYKNVRPDGKALHDTIAAGLTFHPQAATWVRGEPYRSEGEWGFCSIQEIHGDPLFWPTDVERSQRYITISVDADALYQSWVS